MASLLQAVRSAVAPLTRTRAFRAVGPVVLPPAERVLARLSGGRLQISALLVPSLVLRSTGARSGEPRDTYLMYTPDGQAGRVVRLFRLQPLAEAAGQVERAATWAPG